MNSLGVSLALLVIVLVSTVLQGCPGSDFRRIVRGDPPPPAPPPPPPLVPVSLARNEKSQGEPSPVVRESSVDKVKQPGTSPNQISAAEVAAARRKLRHVSSLTENDESKFFQVPKLRHVSRKSKEVRKYEERYINAVRVRSLREFFERKFKGESEGDSFTTVSGLPEEDFFFTSSDDDDEERSSGEWIDAENVQV